MHSRSRGMGIIGLALLLVLAGLTCLPVHAQSFYGSIVGNVTDSTGAAEPGAKVTITNIGTNESQTAVSDGTGSFRFVNLIPSTYRVEVEQANFKRFVRSSIPVQVGAAIRIDAALEVGTTTETVEVTTHPPLLETESSGLSQQVTGKTVQEMPLNGRNTMNLIALASGVVPQGSSMGSTGLNNTSGTTNAGGFANYQIGGNIAGQGAQYVDGAPVNSLGGNSMGLVPTQDSVQEFSVASSNVGAEFGRYGGGVVNMTTKSGSNQWHGSAYEYFRNTVLNGNDFFNKAAQVQLGQKNLPPKFNQNQYGAVFSGPVKKDKAFFLFSWEGFKARLGFASPTKVPTPTLQQGIIPVTSANDFKVGKGGAITGGIVDPRGNCTITKDSTGANFIIPLGVGNCKLDSASAIMKNYWGPPTVINGVQFTDPTGSNYFRTVVVGDNQNQYTGRIDYTLNDKQRLFGRYTYWNITDSNFNQFPMSPYNVGSAFTAFKTHQVVLGDTYTINQKTILDVRLSYMRGQNQSLLPNMNVDEAMYGGQFGTLANSMKFKMYPTPQLGGGRGGSGGVSTYTFYSNFGNGYSGSYNNTYSLSASVIRMAGRHSLKIGGEARKMEAYSLSKSNSGQFQFNGTFTGDVWADFLLGYTSNGSLSVSNWTAPYSFYQAYYVQDTWQASRNLTLNFGLRWELPGGLYEKNNLNTVLLPTTVDPVTKVKGTLALVDSPLNPGRSSLTVRYRQFAPNFGFAYRLGSKMAVRGGIGLSYLPADMGTASPGASPINSNTPSYTASGVVRLYPLSTPVDNFGTALAPPAGRDPNFMLRYVPTVTATSGSLQGIGGGVPGAPLAYMQQWNFSVSRQMVGDWALEVAYAGTKGTHLAALSGQMNQLDPKIAAQYTSKQLLGSTSYVTTTTPGGISQYMTLGQSLRPYPSYTGVSDSNNHWGSTIYHSMQIKSQKRFKSGGLLMLNYTWAKSIGDTDTATPFLEVKSTPTARDKGYGDLQNNYDHRAERSIMSYNMPHRLVASYVMNVPVGRGQKYLNNVHGVADKLVSGWAFNGISSFQTGFPLTIMDSTLNNWASLGGGTTRPNYVPGCQKKPDGFAAIDKLTRWFNTSCFVTASLAGKIDDGAGADPVTNKLVFGNEPRVDGTLRAHGIANWDFSVLKGTKISEKTTFQFRAEFFNLFNRTQFAPPLVSVASEGFGAIRAQANKPRLIQFSARLSF